jgi:two-component system heavy metal sensor histidine kinase CusS
VSDRAAPESYSLIRRLILGFGVSSAVLLITSVVILYLLLVNGIESEKNAILLDRIDAVDALLKSPAHGMEEIHRRIENEWPKRGGETVYVRLVDSHNQVIAESPEIPSDTHEFFDLRQKVEENAIGQNGPVVISAFTSNEQYSHFLSQFREISFLVTAFSVLASILIGWQIARQGMKPVHAVSKTVGNISSENLSARISLEGLPIELHGLAEAFNQSLKRIEESFQRLSRFSDDIAHELRTPINNMMGEVEVTLGRAREPEEYQDALSSTLEECGRLNRMIESMLFIARTDNFDYRLHAESIVVDTELKNILEFFEPIASEKSIQLAIINSDDVSLRVMAEPMLFQRAIGNLLSNAIRYTPENGKVCLKYAKVGSQIEISVEDSGIGIPEEDLENIFERFYRVDHSRTNQSGGFGLGLAIVKHILQIHGGRVIANSSVGIGSVFLTEWPCA